MRSSTKTACSVLFSSVVCVVSAAAQSAPAAAGSSQLRIETMESGFAIGPDVRFTEINDRSATLTGVYGGWITDERLFVGGAGYWLANPEDDFKVAYVGPMLG